MNDYGPKTAGGAVAQFIVLGILGMILSPILLALFVPLASVYMCCVIVRALWLHITGESK